MDQWYKQWRKRMDQYLLNDGLYQLVSCHKEMMEHMSLLDEVNCFDL